ncbi:MAG TPA: prolyl oligopeptidase family serine peptidase, partial [Bacteroidia bacterium]|nr:prolyl oligopeptidase family serine peptidase [Bacteroidia bacterium]
MKRILFSIASVLVFTSLQAQVMTPEMLLQLGKVSAEGISKDGKSVLYSVRRYSIADAKATRKHYMVSVTGGAATEIKDPAALLNDAHLSSDGKHSISSYDIKVKNVFGSDVYPQYGKSDVMIYTDLNYRHWDTWEDGAFGHVFVNSVKDGKVTDSTDIMKGEAFDCPQKPYGGDEDYIWNPNGKEVLYVTKKKFGKDYALSTNTDIYSYNLETGKTSNLTEGMMGYDVKPEFSHNGTLAWLSMKTDGYEADKNDIFVMEGNQKVNLTKDWDGTVNDYIWSSNGKKIYFTAAEDGVVQLFEIEYNGINGKAATVRKVTKGDYDIHTLVGETENRLIIERTDMNHASEVYSLDPANGEMKQLTHENDAVYATLKMPKVERRYVTAADGQKMLVWVVLPPDFDKTKQYPTLLYCQGGPQSPLTQFYSFRWNFQLMASKGYIIVAPNRHGMPGHGVKWNEEISRDYGGQNMKDYLNAIDEVSKEPYVDKNRRGCVGASYGGYSVYFLAGIHEKRFKSFIAHDGIFDWKSMYGTTEEMWFVNADLGGAYWEKDNAAAQKSYDQFNPINHVKSWDTPIMIIQGG